MSFLLPSAMAIGAVAIAAVIAAHFITRSRPRPEQFPTARFVPDRPLRARARTLALDDIALLLLRAAALVALAGAVAALARTTRGRVLRVIALDRSRAVGALSEVRDSVRAVARTGDVVIAFDTAATLISNSGLDSLVGPSRTPGSLSTAFAASIGMAARTSSRADSIELVMVSPFASDEMDAATLRIRASWPGRVRLVPVSAASPHSFDTRVETSATLDDPIVAGLAVAGLLGSGSVRLIRGEPSALDSAWSRGAGHVLIHWPANASVARWSRRSSVDTVGAVSTSATVVARFARVWSPAAIAGRPIARWIDGEPAATEQAMGEGCMREVAIVIDPAGDLTLRPAFRSFIQSLLMPCGGERAAARLAPAMLDSLAGTGPLAAAMTLRDRHEVASPWTTWLLIAGAMLLIVELAVRRQRTTAA